VLASDMHAGLDRFQAAINGIDDAIHDAFSTPKSLGARRATDSRHPGSPATMTFGLSMKMEDGLVASPHPHHQRSEISSRGS